MFYLKQNGGSRRTLRVIWLMELGKNNEMEDIWRELNGWAGVEDGTVIFQANTKIMASSALQTEACVMLTQEKRILKIRVYSDSSTLVQAIKGPVEIDKIMGN